MSVFAGVVPLRVHTGVEGKAKIENLTKIGNFVFGFGVRSLFYWPGFLDGSLGRKVFQPMRINVGVMRYAQVNENPLISKKEVKSAFFISLTYDINIGDLLGKPIKGFFGS